MKTRYFDICFLARLVRFRILILCLVCSSPLMLVSHSALARPACRQILAEAAAHFEYREPSTADIPSGNRTSRLFLGEGASAVAWLVRDPKSPTELIVMKIYHFDAHGLDRHHRDTLVLKKLGSLVNHDVELEFRSVQAENFMLPGDYRSETPPQFGSYLPFVRGRTVHDLLNDPQVPAEVHRQVSKIFNQKLLALKEKIERDGDVVDEPELTKSKVEYFMDHHVDESLVLRGVFKGETGKFLLKSDNVVVDPFDLEKMTIIDPY